MNKDKSIVKIKATDDIEINGIIYFIPDKYIENKKAFFIKLKKSKNVSKLSIIARFL